MERMRRSETKTERFEKKYCALLFSEVFINSIWTHEKIHKHAVSISNRQGICTIFRRSASFSYSVEFLVYFRCFYLCSLVLLATITYKLLRFSLENLLVLIDTGCFAWLKNAQTYEAKPQFDYKRIKTSCKLLENSALFTSQYLFIPIIFSVPLFNSTGNLNAENNTVERNQFARYDWVYI